MPPTAFLRSGALYKTLRVANIIIVLIITSVIVFIAVFPVFSSVCLNVNMYGKTAGFSLYLFGIPVYSINVKLDGNRIQVKKTFKKPYLLSLSPSVAFKAKMPVIKNISVLSVKITSDIGIKGDIFLPITIIFALDAAKYAVFGAIKSYRPHIRLCNDINVFDGKSVLRAYIRVKTVFNLIDVAAIVIGAFLEKIRYAIAK